MPNKKKLFFKFCSFFPFEILAQINSHNSLFVPIYHAITNERLIHLEHILPYGSKNARQFENDLDHLLKKLNPISYDDLLSCIKTNTPVPPRSFIVTFDDGLRQTYELAPDILERKGVPAIFYINSAVVDNKALLHRYKTSILIEHVKSSGNKASQVLVEKILADNGIVAGSWIEAIRKVHFGFRNLLDTIALALDVSFEDYLNLHKPYMTTSQLQDLRNRGFILGSHSAWHPEYWNISLQDQVNQSREAMEFLRHACGETHRTFSFPFTDVRTPVSFFKSCEKEYPFELYFGSQKLKKDVIPNMIQRFDGDNNLSDMSTYLKTLLVFQTLNKIRGKSVFVRAEN